VGGWFWWNSSNLGASSTTITYPAINNVAGGVPGDSDDDDFYVGYCFPNDTPSAGTTPGFSYATTTNDDQFCWELSGYGQNRVSPTATQATSGAYFVMGASVFWMPNNVPPVNVNCM
jgi:hypothetical protein